MLITRTNHLNNTNFEACQSLISICEKYDSISPLFFCEEEMNALSDFNCYNLFFSGNLLTGIVSVFIPGDGSAEIYCYTHPEFRRQGILNILCTPVIETLEKKGVSKILFVCDPSSKTAAEVIKHKGYSLKYSEFLLILKKDFIPKPSGILSLSVCEKFETQGNQLLFETFSDNKKSGSCLVELSDSFSCIFDFNIEYAQRGKGFGHETLLLILDYLIKNCSKNVILHLNGDNIAAKTLYLNNGFEIQSQVDYIGIK